jgi:hypothetical protein
MPFENVSNFKYLENILINETYIHVEVKVKKSKVVPVLC